MAEQYKIKAAVSHIGLKVGEKKIYSYPRIGHHFWVLVKVSDGVETMVDSIHGLATRLQLEKDGKLTLRTIQVVGTWHSYLQLYNIPFSESVDSLKKDTRLSWTPPAETYAMYCKEDAFIHWEQAREWVDTFNASQLSYSVLGLGRTLGFRGCQNSNSAYASVASFLGLKPHRFKNYAAPGVTTILSKVLIENNRKKYVVEDESHQYRLNRP